MRHPEGARVVEGLRVLFFDGQSMYGARGRYLVISEDRGRTWERCGRVELPMLPRLATWWRPTQRLARTEVYKLHRCGDQLVALARGGVYAGSIREGVLRQTFRVSQGSRPVSLAVGPTNEVLIGEYHSNPARGPMRIYRSMDCVNWEVVHEFPAGDIRHVHGIYYDRYVNCYWVLVGDEQHEPGIARCSPDFSEVRFVRRGSQQVRAVSLIVRPQGLVFATDSERDRNAIYFMDRDGVALEELHELENSCFHSGEFADFMFFATVCEPSPRNDQTTLHLWTSHGGQTWSEVARYRKDRFPYLMQYGNVFFPEGETQELEELIYSGTALRGLDDATVFLPLSSLRIPQEPSPHSTSGVRR